MLVIMSLSAAAFAAACAARMVAGGVKVAKWLLTSMSHVVAETMVMS